MAKDYDTPRKTDDDVQEDSFEELQSRRQSTSSSSLEAVSYTHLRAHET